MTEGASNTLNFNEKKGVHFKLGLLLNKKKLLQKEQTRFFKSCPSLERKANIQKCTIETYLCTLITDGNMLKPVPRGLL